MPNRRRNESAKRVAWVAGSATLVGMAIALIGFIGSGFDVKAKAESAYKFVEDNRALPTRVEQCEKESEELKTDFKSVPTDIATMKGQITALVGVVGTLAKHLETLSKNVTDHIIQNNRHAKVPVGPGGG